MQNLINYYIVHRATGVSFDPTYISRSGAIMTAIANTAVNKDKVINVSKLIKGLTERRYRLVPKTITQ